jgi:hypothetical protein
MTLAPLRPAGLDEALLAAVAQQVRGSLTFLVGDEALTYRSDGRAITEDATADGDVVVRLDATAWADLVGQVRTSINLLLSGALAFERGGFEDLARWDVPLSYLHAGIPPYTPRELDGDPTAVLSLDDSDDVLREQLSTMGYLHVRGVFSAPEMATANAEIDRLAELARPGDEQSWWVTGEDGEQVLCRLVYATLRSPVLKALEDDPRIARLGHLLSADARLAPDRMEGSAVLLKVPGRTQGLSNIPWHQDCGMGGHAIFCPAVSIGIQLTGSNAQTGNLTMVPGSHGQRLPYGWQDIPNVPTVSIDTEPGDVTVHVQDVMHASPKPTGLGGRRTMYVTHYPPALWDHIGPGQAYNDLVRNRTEQVAAL